VTQERWEPGAVPKGARAWEESFRDHEVGWFFGGEPSTLARRLLHFFRMLEIPTAGRLLDLGCGEGRDVAFFASLGFDVEALDGSPTGVERTRRAISEGGLHARVSQGDLASFEWTGEYDIVFANNSVQFVGEQARRVLSEIRSHTRPGGWNAIGMFTREEIDWRREPDLYCLDHRELKHIYRDWTLLEYGESIVYSPRRAQYISFANLIARRPHSR
jgi:tellurite methyltransferase